jgi:uncharacterized repeat protein (TIGR03803 family)
VRAKVESAHNFLKRHFVPHAIECLVNSTDGALPLARLVMDSKGSLYGTAYEGGKYSQGTVFEVTP